MLYVLEVLNLLNRPMTHRWPAGPCFSVTALLMMSRRDLRISRDHTVRGVSRGDLPTRTRQTMTTQRPTDCVPSDVTMEMFTVYL